MTLVETPELHGESHFGFHPGIRFLFLYPDRNTGSCVLRLSDSFMDIVEIMSRIHAMEIDLPVLGGCARVFPREGENVPDHRAGVIGYLGFWGL
jgi:hypothetical protein